MIPADPPAAPGIGLPPEQFAAAFPFHFAIDESLALLQAGATLARLCPDVRPDARLDDVFRSVRPEGRITIDWVHAHMHRFFLLEHGASGLQLRGQFVALPGQKRLLFLGSPWFTDAAEIAARGLGFDDFAVHDPVVDLLQVFQSSKMALADAKKAAAKLSVQREELRAANERLRLQEREARRLALIAARTDNAVVLTDAAGLVLWVNEGFTRLTGYAPDEVRGRRPGAVLQGPGTDPATVRRIRERLQRSEGFTEEILNYRKDGREYWAAIEVQPIVGDSGQIESYMSIESDVTERRAAEQRLVMQFEVASVLAESDDQQEAFHQVLQAMSQRLNWQLGQIWVVDKGRLSLARSWHLDSAQLSGFVDVCKGMHFALTEGLPGQVMGTGQPLWAEDVTREPNFLRADAAIRAGLRGASLVPIVVRGKMLGVLEFFSVNRKRADGALLRTFATVAVQIGEFIGRQEAQQAVRRSEERFRSAFDDAYAGVALVGLDGRFVQVNPSLCEMLGYAKTELIGRSVLGITHPADLHTSEEALRRVHSGDVERLELEKRYVRKDGQVIWVLIRSRRQRDAGGGQDLMVSHFLDITARKEAERELAQAEERFRLALEGADLGTWDLHVPSGVVTLNDRYVQMLGYGEDELWRRRVRYVSWYAELLACAKGATGPRVEDWAHFLHPEDAARVLQAFAAHLRGETAVFDSEYRMRHKSGDWVWILDRGRIIERDRNGAPLRVCGTHLDITFRKVAEQALQREKQLLEEAQQRELQTGFEIQRALLIGEVPPLDPGLDIAAYAVPSRGIDGDFYAFTRFRGDCFELLVGDVMGKGVPAALVGAAVRTAYNHVVTELMVAELGGGALPKPAEIVNALHARLTPRLVELETFATLALYRFDLASGRLTFVNAGHTAGLLRRRDGQIEAILGENVPVGAVEDEQYVEATRAIGAGDSLLVYSDGITEACSGEGVAFGEQRLGRLLQDLCASAAPARVRLQALHKRLLDYAGERAIPDDETAVLIDLQGPFAAGGRTQDDVVDEELIELPWNVAGLEPLRRRVAAAGITLEADAVDRLVLAAFEVVTNVVRHVKQPFAEATLSCRLRSEPDRVTVEVWYVGLPFTPAMQRAPDLSGETEGGFGLYIIENAVTRVSYEQPMPDVCCTRLVQMSGASAPV